MCWYSVKLYREDQARFRDRLGIAIAVLLKSLFMLWSWILIETGLSPKKIMTSIISIVAYMEKKTTTDLPIVLQILGQS